MKLTHVILLGIGSFIVNFAITYFLLNSNHNPGPVLLPVTSCNHNLREYQIRLEIDSAYIYDGTRLVGSCKHGQDGIDSLILLDNL